jgi:hypothetical protein
MIPFNSLVSNKIGRLLEKYNIKTVHILERENFSFMRTVKDKLDLKVAGIYCVPCECGKVYIGQTGGTIEARCKEHMRHIRLGQPEKSAVAEHRFHSGHNIDFSSVSILNKVTGFMDRIIKEAIEIRLHPRNFNTDGGFTLSCAWYPVLNMLQGNMSHIPGDKIVHTSS